jgi:hypothetical protein
LQTKKETTFVKVLEISAKSCAAAFLMLLGLASSSAAQQPRKAPTPALIIDQMKREMPVATGNNLYCSGYIQNSPVNTNFEIVGANKEREQNIFAQGDLVYVNRGANTGVKVGDMFSVIRPRGQFSSRFSRKGRLGIYVQEVGAVEIVSVKNEVSVARVKTSCDSFMIGDLLQPMETRVSPMFQQRPALDIFRNPSGKAMGRIVMARNGRESPAREEIVYIDLGREDNVQVGDYLTIFRPLGKGGVVNSQQNESVAATSEGFESRTYSGGKFSTQAGRKSGANAEGKVVTSNDAKTRRPGNLRKVVGEMVILNVKERTATALITRNAEEIHTGDMVEIQ